MRYLKYLVSLGFLIFGCWSIFCSLSIISLTVNSLPWYIEICSYMSEAELGAYRLLCIEGILQMLTFLVTGVLAVIISLKQSSWGFIRNTGLIRLSGFLGMFVLTCAVQIDGTHIVEFFKGFFLKGFIESVLIIILAFLVKRWGSKIYSPLPARRFFRFLLNVLKKVVNWISNAKIKWD